MEKLRRDTVLVFGTALDLRLRTDGLIEAETSEGRCEFGPHALSVLEYFRRPHSVDQAILGLTDRCISPQEWADLCSTIDRLHAAGILTEPGHEATTTAVSSRTFDSPVVHARMLNDRVRTEHYLSALREVIKPDDVVVDLGTGSGILAVTAALLGARRVYAIEASAIASVAEAVARANGVGDVVQVLRGWSTEITLPERVSVIVSETIGNNPFGERVLETLRDARQRFAAPGARLIPSELELFVRPMELTPDQLGDRLPTVARAQAWKARYGVDLSPLAESVAAGWAKEFVGVEQARQFKPLGPAASVGTFALGQPFPGRAQAAGAAAIEQDGDLGGVLLYFAATLSPAVRLSLDPDHVEWSSWRLPLWSRATPLAVRSGDVVRYGYAWWPKAAGDSDLSVSIERG